MSKIDKSLLSGSTSMLVLALLRESDKYGYQMITELALRSDNTFELKEGTLYPVLHALEKDGALKSYDKQAPSGKMRKYYSITKEGLKKLHDKQLEWEEYTTAVNMVLKGGVQHASF